jgi:uncharacterized protein YuzE
MAPTITAVRAIDRPKAIDARLVEGVRSAKQVVVDDDDLWKPIVIDLDGEGHVVGFEFLDASELLPAKLLDEFR